MVLHLWSCICKISPLHVLHSVLGRLVNAELGCVVFTCVSFTEEAQFHFFFFPGYHRKNILPGTKYSIQNREPDTANNLELVVQELQREFPSILTNEWEPHSFDSSVGYMWFYSTTFQLYVDFSFFTSVFFMWNKNPSMNLWDMQERLNLLLQLHSAGSVLHTLFGFS